LPFREEADNVEGVVDVPVQTKLRPDVFVTEEPGFRRELAMCAEEASVERDWGEEGWRWLGCDPESRRG
jgi:hypothetical protein